MRKYNRLSWIIATLMLSIVFSGCAGDFKKHEIDEVLNGSKALVTISGYVYNKEVFLGSAVIPLEIKWKNQRNDGFFTTKGLTFNIISPGTYEIDNISFQEKKQALIGWDPYHTTNGSLSDKVHFTVQGGEIIYLGELACLNFNPQTASFAAYLHSNEKKTYDLLYLLDNEQLYNQAQRTLEEIAPGLKNVKMQKRLLTSPILKQMSSEEELRSMVNKVTDKNKK